jgi:hypothetical protein
MHAPAAGVSPSYLKIRRVNLKSVLPRYQPVQCSALRAAGVVGALGPSISAQLGDMGVAQAPAGAPLLHFGQSVYLPKSVAPAAQAKIWIPDSAACFRAAAVSRTVQAISSTVVPRASACETTRSVVIDSTT